MSQAQIGGEKAINDFKILNLEFVKCYDTNKIDKELKIKKRKCRSKEYIDKWLLDKVITV